MVAKSPVTRQLLEERFPLPRPDEDADKATRARVLIVGGSRATPGSVVLAGLAALRVGAGKVRIATVAATVPHIGVAFPEAGVFGLYERDDGAIDAEADETQAAIERLVRNCDVVLVGTGVLDPAGMEPLLDAVIGEVPVVIDAAAIEVAATRVDAVRRLRGRALLIPNAREMSVLGDDVHAVARSLNAIVACRGPNAEIAAPDGECYVDDSGGVGLATAGSGDVAAGIAAGLLARGVEPLPAALWMANLHGRAGEALAKRVASIGFLARELLDELPSLAAPDV